MGSIAASPSLGLILILSHAHASGFILSSEHTKSCKRLFFQRGLQALFLMQKAF
jgi:hypothetical protein